MKRANIHRADFDTDIIKIEFKIQILTNTTSNTHTNPDLNNIMNIMETDAEILILRSKGCDR